MKNTLVVNLFGGPGSGKSTGAAFIFAQLKLQGISCELVTEFAKDKTWEENKIALANQFYVFGNQCYRLSLVNNKVDIIITDSPLPLSNYYAGNSPIMYNFKKACIDVFNTYTNLNFFLNRVKKYDANGRNQTEEESNNISNEIKHLLNSNDIIYKEVEGSEKGYKIILEEILKTLNF